MNQIVIAIKKENVLTYLTLFDNRPESFTAFSETRLRDKELWDPGYTAKTDIILFGVRWGQWIYLKETQAAP